MVPQREIRYYASIPKIILLLFIMAGLTFIGWNGLVTGYNAYISWMLLSVGGLGALVALLWLLFTVALRQPILRINDAGLTSSPPLKPWLQRFIPWDDVGRIGINAQQLSKRTTNYYFVVEARRPDRYTAPASWLGRLSVRVYPTLAGVEMTVLLNWLFLRASRTRRAQLLERIKTTFAPEIAQYDIWLDETEQPM